MNHDEALTLLNKVYQTKFEWFIEHKISECYFVKKEIEKAFNFAFKAFMNNGK